MGSIERTLSQLNEIQAEGRSRRNAVLMFTSLRQMAQVWNAQRHSSSLAQSLHMNMWLHGVSTTFATFAWHNTHSGA